MLAYILILRFTTHSNVLLGSQVTASCFHLLLVILLDIKIDVYVDAYSQMFDSHCNINYEMKTVIHLDKTNILYIISTHMFIVIGRNWCNWRLL